MKEMKIIRDANPNCSCVDIEIIEDNADSYDRTASIYFNPVWMLFCLALDMDDGNRCKLDNWISGTITCGCNTVIIPGMKEFYEEISQ